MRGTWYEVRRFAAGKYDAVTTQHKTRKQAQKAEAEAKASGKYEVVYIERLNGDGVID